MNFYPHHIGDYAQDTRHLTMLEHGAYRLLLDLYYSREAPLPLDVSTVQRLACARAREEKQAVEAVLREFFIETAEGWRHNRCDLEIEAGRRKQDAARENGKKGGRKPKPNPPGSNPLTQWVPAGLDPVNPAGTQGKAPNPNPNPNPPQPPDGAGGGEGDSEAAPAPVAPAVRLAIAAREAGVECTGSDPRLIELAEQGVSVSTLLAAIEESKRAKGPRPSLGYVLAVLSTWARDVARLTVNGAAQPTRGGGVVALPSAATPDEAILRGISERHGGESVTKLPDGRYRCGGRYFRPDGREEMAI